jgi:hypothetical protein
LWSFRIDVYLGARLEQCQLYARVSVVHGTSKAGKEHEARANSKLWREAEKGETDFTAAAAWGRQELASKLMHGGSKFAAVPSCEPGIGVHGLAWTIGRSQDSDDGRIAESREGRPSTKSRLEDDVSTA